MMDKSAKYFRNLLLFGSMLLLGACYPSEELKVPEKEDDTEYTELDEYINDNFVEKYGMVVRYRYRDDFLAPGQRAIPVDVEYVRPMLDFLEKFWIAPFLSVDNGEEFFLNHVPAEIVLLGGPVFEGSTQVLGLAEAGASVTLLDVNKIDLEDEEWVFRQLNIIYHEFAHVVHQRYKLPSGFETISPTGYTGPGSWYVLDDNDALKRGFVTPYATSQVTEDFAELVSFYTFDPEFQQKYIDQEDDCNEPECELVNEGKNKISQKLASVANHYEKVTGVSLADLRNELQSVLEGE